MKKKEIKTTMKKRDWYALLDEYNRLVEEKNYNVMIVNTESFTEKKEAIIAYLTKKYCAAEADMIGIVRDLSQDGYGRTVAEKIFYDEFAVKWAKKAENIIAAVKEGNPIEKTDIEESFYGIRFYNGRLNLLQFIILCGFCVALFIIIFLTN